MRKRIAQYGTHGRSVKVFVETFKGADRQTLVRVQWRENGKLRTESLPDSRDHQTKAKAFASGVAERLALKGPETRERITLRELGIRYARAHPVPETWREKTRKSFDARWRVITVTLTPDKLIDTITPETVDRLREAMREREYAVNQIANHVQQLKSAMSFARERKYITENPIADYRMKLSRDQRKAQIPEWTAEECAAILAELSPRQSRQWRAYVAIVLDALLGTRSNALLNLEWRDVDLNARHLRWRPELDKLGKDRLQPLPRDAVRALRIAKVWRGRIGYTGPYVIPGARDSHKAKAFDHPYRYQSLNYTLREAASRAGVPWIDYRAMHGFRRMVLNNALALTGNLTRAGQWIGDTDARTLSRSYVRERADDMRDMAAGTRLPEAAPKRNATKQQTSNDNEKAPLAGAGGGGVKP